MTDYIKNINLNDNSILTLRNLTSDADISSIDINQVTGEYLLTKPLNTDGRIGGNLWLCPASEQLSGVNTITIIKNFIQTGSLYYPYDARFDYARNKIWICDTGNDRVVKIDKNKLDIVDVIVDELIYPHAIAVNYNTGGIFIKAYNDIGLNNGIVYSLKSDGQLNYSFVYYIDTSESSSSSSISLSSSWSSSSFDTFISLPSPNSIAYDHVRGRVWWGSKNKVYMFDEKTNQISTLDLSSNNLYFAYSISIEYETGNAFVVCGDIHEETYLAQIFRDNNVFLGKAYLAE